MPTLNLPFDLEELAERHGRDFGEFNRVSTNSIIDKFERELNTSAEEILNNLIKEEQAKL